ncbi:MAG TPA: nitroreductase family protein [bacterium]|nr:nitroreductase family protein [bacterium]
MDFSKTIESRRSVNFFDPAKDVDDALMRKIYDLAKLAPSSFNLQPWRAIIVRDPENKAKLQKCAFNQPKISQASCTLILIGDKKAYQKMDPIIDDNIALGYMKEEMRDAIKGMAKGLYEGDNERAFVGRNTGLFAMAFMLAAQSLGVNTHPMDGFDSAAVRDAFHVPDEYDIVMLIAVGIFDDAKTLLPRTSRRSYDEAFIKESL